MILQALKEYYDRKAADPKTNTAPEGFEWKEIPYILVLDKMGNPISLNCTYEGSGKARRAKKFLVPQSVKRASGIAANLLWDNPEYTFGVDFKGKPDRVAEQHAAFIKRIEILGKLDEPGLNAVKHFLSRPNIISDLETMGDSWEAVLEEGAIVSFQLAGSSSLVAESTAVKEAIQSANKTSDADISVCLITGRDEPIERLHPAIKGVWGAQTTGANIVSFNLDAFGSFGKKQGANAPVGKSTAFAYTNALNHLLAKDSRQRMQIGDASTVFWSAKPTFLEEHMADFFAEPPKDDPDRNTRAVKSLFNAVHSGAIPPNEKETDFFVLGLAPNASRIAIRYWIADTIESMAQKICAHFEDLEIIHNPKAPDVLSLFRILVSLAPLGKADNLPPNLAGDTVRAVLLGLPYPRTLLQAAIRRIRSEQDLPYPRAAIIKACINRALRYSNPTKERKLTVSLDDSNTNIGYLLGRLFATLEKVQQEANPGINATIRDRYYGAASGTPVAVFANLMRLKNHHLAKLEHAGRRVQFEKLIAQIMDGIGDFPAHLPLAEQGRFAIGYYHQMQHFFTKKSTTAE